MSSPPLPQPQLRIRIDQIDHTLIQPGSLGISPLAYVPVIRVYGILPCGIRACVHIHQVYPYFYVNYPSKLEPSSVKKYISQLQSCLNHTIALSLGRDPDSVRSQFIRAIILVKGVQFYGFHSGYSPFLKILVADPILVSRVVAILQSGVVMGTQFFVYESHLNFTLQFLSDFGLYGCGWMDLGEVFQRGYEEDMEDDYFAPMGSIQVSDYFRQSRMPLEFDAIAAQILNRRAIVVRDLHDKLVIPAPPPSDQHLVKSVQELWDDEQSRRKAKNFNPIPEMPVDPSDSTRGAGGDWIAECRWWEDLRRRIQREAEATPNNIATTQGWEEWVVTAFDSTEALWEDKWRTYDENPLTQNIIVQAAERASEESIREIHDQMNDQHGLHCDNPEVGLSLLLAQDFERGFDEEETAWDLGVDADEQPEEEDGEDQSSAEEDLQLTEENSSQGEDGSDIDNNRPPSSSPNPFVDTYGAQSNYNGKYHLNSLPEVTMDLDSPGPSSDEEQALLLSGNRKLHSRSDMSSEVGPRRIPAINTSSQSKMPTFFVSSQSSTGEVTPHPLKRRRVAFGETEKDSSGTHRHLLAPSSLSSADTQPNPKKRSIRPTLVPAHAKMENKNRFVYSHAPPATSSLISTLGNYGLPTRIYRVPYYSKYSDGSVGPREYAGLVFRIKAGTGADTLEDWDSNSHEQRYNWSEGESSPFISAEAGGWEYASSPPSAREVRKWLASPEGKVHQRFPKSIRSQIKGSTQRNPFGLRASDGGNALAKQSMRPPDMSALSLEVFAPSIEGKLPDPRSSDIAVAFIAYQDTESSPLQTQIIAVGSTIIDSRRLRTSTLNVVENEVELINTLVDLVVDLDPDILVGWEIQKASWGYLVRRAIGHGLDIQELIARAPPRTSLNHQDKWGLRTTATFKVVGRHVFNLWRIIRSEQNYTDHTFEHVAFNLLRRSDALMTFRVPWYSPATLTDLFLSPVPAHGAALIRYFRDRVAANLEILNVSGIVTKTAEFARVFGVDFFAVISRGSQYKVESLMLRIAKPENFILLSPSKSDVGTQNAAECMPLIMEPLSAFYPSPLVVLDFQSLYPSLMIAYNYCYSTCLGRVNNFRGQNKLGVIDLIHPPGLVADLKDHLTIAPNGIMYVKPEVRMGLLGRMLKELLETRIMVKHSMKVHKSDKALKRILDARQLSLKYICNVTYGYTGATYSGRMPAVEIADSIVQSGRETLEKAINVINSTTRWGAKVVYGDTDSVFVYLRGKTREQAFQIGAEIAHTITSLNPAPVKLKFEKVYHPCVLLSKKRYVGAKYESIDELEPVFEAKGIETVRRDGVPAQRKMLERALKTLFRTQNLSEVKDYCCRSWAKLLENNASLQDFIFSKEVKLGTYSDKGPPPPGVAVAVRRMLQDPVDEPQYGERIPYVITKGAPNTRLVDRAIDPLTYLKNTRYELDANYYIARVLIPPLDRVFSLIGADVRQWFEEMPRSVTAEPSSPSKHKAVKADSTNINEHFLSTQCLICGSPAPQGICFDCWYSRPSAMASLSFRVRAEENRKVSAHRICASCTHAQPGEPIYCESLDCPWLYARYQAKDMEDFVVNLGDTIDELRREEEAENSKVCDELTPSYGTDDKLIDLSLKMEETPD